MIQAPGTGLSVPGERRGVQECEWKKQKHKYSEGDVERNWFRTSMVMVRVTKTSRIGVQRLVVGDGVAREPRYPENPAPCLIAR